MMNHEIQSVFSSLTDRPIAFQPIYAKITGSITSGLLLSQITYWAKVMKYEEFYKTDRELYEELCMGRYELDRAKKVLANLSLVSIVRKGVPAKSFYKLDMERLISLILDYNTQQKNNPQTHGGSQKTQLAGNQQTRVLETSKLECWKPANLSAENQRTITENTTENTTDIGRVFDQNASTPILEVVNNNLVEANNENQTIDGEKTGAFNLNQNLNQDNIYHNIYNTVNSTTYDSNHTAIAEANTSNQETYSPKTTAKPKKRESNRGTTLPDDWELPDDLKQWALDASGWTAQFIEKQAEKFHDHHLSKGTISKSWAASWRYWCRNSAEYKGDYLKTKKQLKVESRESPKPIQTETPIPEEYQDDWDKVREGLKNKLGDATYLSWIAQLYPKEIQEDCLIIEASTRFNRDWIQQKYYEDVKQTCKSIMGVDDISLVVKGEGITPTYSVSQHQFNDRGVAHLAY